MSKAEDDLLLEELEANEGRYKTAIGLLQRAVIRLDECDYKQDREFIAEVERFLDDERR